MWCALLEKRMMPVFCSWLVRFGVKAVKGLQKRFAGIFVAMSLSVKAYGKASRGSRCSPVKMSKLCRGYPLGTGSLHWLSLFSSSFGKVLSVEFTKAVFISAPSFRLSLELLPYLLGEALTRLLSSISSMFLGREYDENTEPLGWAWGQHPADVSELPWAEI